MQGVYGVFHIVYLVVAVMAMILEIIILKKKKISDDKLQLILKIEGAIGRFGDVEYSNSMKAACGIAVILESDDLDQEWIEKQNK